MSLRKAANCQVHLQPSMKKVVAGFPHGQCCNTISINPPNMGAVVFCQATRRESENTTPFLSGGMSPDVFKIAASLPSPSVCQLSQVNSSDSFGRWTNQIGSRDSGTLANATSSRAGSQCRKLPTGRCFWDSRGLKVVS